MSTRRHMPADDFDVDRMDGGRSSRVEDPVALAPRESRAGRSRVADAMSQPVVVRPNASIDQIACLLEEERIHGVAVVGAEGELLGVVTRTNLLAHLRRTKGAGFTSDPPGAGIASRAQAMSASDLVTPAPATVSDTATVAEAASLLATQNVHQLPVVLQSGKLVGMVSALDLARWLASER